MDDRGNQRLTVFGAEDQVNQGCREGLRHRGVTPFQGWRGFGDRVPRALPWADESKPFGLDFKSCGLAGERFGLSSLAFKTCKHNSPFVI
jgi:hypothetical protein